MLGRLSTEIVDRHLLQESISRRLHHYAPAFLTFLILIMKLLNIILFGSVYIKANYMNLNNLSDDCRQRLLFPLYFF